jgi:transposase
MKLTIIDYERISDCLPRQRGNVTHDNLSVLNGIVFVLENGCKWRAMPKEFGCWHTVYTRMNRWSKNGVLHRVFERLQRDGMMRVLVTVMSLDSTSIRVHPDGTGALKKKAPSPSGAPAAGSPPNFIWLPRMRAAQSCSASPEVRKAARRGGASC